MKLVFVMTVYLISVNTIYRTMPAFADNILRKVTLFLLKQKQNLRRRALFFLKSGSIYMFYNMYRANYAV